MSEPRSQCGMPGPIDATPYGKRLAERVADYLIARAKIAYVHRDYCGMGLFYRDGQFLYGEVWDGDLGAWDRYDESVVTFPDRAVFIAWLSQQSDDSLYGHDAREPWYQGNQRITRARLESEMATQALVTALAATEFATRYYRLCERFSKRLDSPGRCTEQDVLAILTALGRTPTTYLWQLEPWPCPVFNFGGLAGGRAGFSQFYLVNLESVQFWCYFDHQGVRAGGDVKVLAHGALQAAAMPIPDLPYPQPVYHTAGELQEVLAELFALQDLAAAVVIDEELSENGTA